MKRFLVSCILMLNLLLTGCVFSTGHNSDSGAKLGLELISEGFTAPLVLVQVQDDNGQFFVADQDGRIWILTSDYQRLEEPFLDLRTRMVDLRSTYDERGLLGLALHPNYVENGRFFVYYSAPLRAKGPQSWDHTSHISEFHRSESDPNRANLDSERLLLQIDQPQSNHNGGQITFGPDGFLYVPIGDGGGANDIGTGHSPKGNAQDLSNLLGSILRLDVNQVEPYGIPPENPFVDKDGLPEIWAYGLRNPFRISFDRGGEHQLFTGDAGQNLYEEIDILGKGGNYGWNLREGRHCFDPQQPGSSPEQCPEVGYYGEILDAPILEYDHDLGLAVIGGYVYRGSQIPSMEGHYIFGDWSSSFVNPDGKIFEGIPPSSPQESWTMRTFNITTSESGNLDVFVISFGEDVAGELYALTSNWPGPIGSTGKIYKLVNPESSETSK